MRPRNYQSREESAGIPALGETTYQSGKDIFAVVRLEGEGDFSKPFILELCETKRRLPRIYRSYMAQESKRNRGKILPVKIHGGQPLFLDEIVRNAFKQSKAHVNERKAA